jgi:hypothetical protein
VRSTPLEWLEQGIDYSFWFPNAETGEFGLFYLWATGGAMEEEIRSRTRVKAMTGVGPSIHPALDKGLSGPSGTKLERRPVPLGR